MVTTSLSLPPSIEAVYELLGFRPNPGPQEEILEAVLGNGLRFPLISGGEQSGKHIHVDTPIATADGWKRMGDLEVGDWVFDDSGKPTRVTYVTTPVFEPSYRLSFDNGDEIVASASHQWVASNYSARKHRLSAKVWSTQDMVDGGLIRLAPNNHRPFANWSIAAPRSLDLPHADLPIDPYVLGAWLGDGSSGSADITTVDDEVLTNLAWSGIDIRPKQSTDITFGIALAPKGVRGAPIQPAMRALGVLGNKHIPQIYLRASFEQRLALLQGLMDTDGYIDKRGRIEYYTTSETLKDGFQELVASFGMSYRVRSKRAMLYGKDCGVVWTIQFQTKLPVFRLHRKLRRMRNEKYSVRSDNIYITGIENVGLQPVRCITVDSGSHMYLAGRGMIPTHNTLIVARMALALHIMANPGKRLYWLVAADYDRTRRVFDYLAEDFSQLGLVKFVSNNVNPGRIELLDGSLYLTKSSNDPKTLAMVGPDGIIVDEASQIDLHSFHRLMARAAPKRAWMLMAGTMEGSLGWWPGLIKSWEAPGREYRSFILPTKSNLALYPGGDDDPELKRIREAIPEDLYKERFEGVPTPPSGIVFREARADIHVKDVKYDPSLPVMLWEDPGYNHAHAIEVAQMQDGQVCIVDEIYERNLTTEDIIDHILVNRPWWNAQEGITLVSDPRYKDQHHSVHSVAEVWLGKTGLVALGDKVNINEGTERMKTFLRPDPISGKPGLVIAPHCQGLLSELGLALDPFDGQQHVYRWNTDREGNIVGQTPKDQYNDAVKAVIYGLVYNYGMVRSNAPSKVVVKRF